MLVSRPSKVKTVVFAHAAQVRDNLVHFVAATLRASGNTAKAERSVVGRRAAPSISLLLIYIRQCRDALVRLRASTGAPATFNLLHIAALGLDGGGLAAATVALL